MTQEQKNNIIKWIEALRSGTFEQAQNRLKIQEKDKASYCCLGVACKINGIPENEDSFLWSTRKENELPDIRWFRRTFGFDCNINFDPYEKMLSTLNDEEGKSFSEIADIIEKEFLC